jgi:hypothetical protein
MTRGWNTRCRLPFVLAVSFLLGLGVAVLGVIPFLRERQGLTTRFDIVFSIMGVLFLPGDIASIAVSGNFHDHSLMLGVILNWLIYALCSFLVLKRICKARGRIE